MELQTASNGYILKPQPLKRALLSGRSHIYREFTDTRGFVTLAQQLCSDRSERFN